MIIQPPRLAASAALLLLLVVFLRCSDETVSETNGVPAIFVFGDSLVDVGNNNFLRSVARANYYPYGIDFLSGPTGRFSNGRTVIDMFVDMFGIPNAPEFANPNTTGVGILHGVNYASAAAGILDETGRHYGERYSLSQQVVNFESTLNELRRSMGSWNLSRYLSKSLAFLVFGSNDYINNYLLPELYTSRFRYTPNQFANLLLNRYSRQLLALQSVGLRKFVVAGVGPLGCIPNQRASGAATPGRCVDNVNKMLGAFNEGLRSLVTQLNSQHPESTFVYVNVYAIFGDILNNPDTYGFRVVDTACCGVGLNRGQITCLPLQFPCLYRNEYVFWDAFHPTEAASAILAGRAFRGPPSDSYPINVRQLALI
ncbi:GDSL esterase/lipase At1g71250-like [Cucurbita pepo subsp. pepo]|uniref:GDSL esterase/lipase At1g71250-like n=1 Tax=Cucurbita pepo subsp. pepo TaxID=3664 RepID=UPI000C9D9DF8|nr:GDSL esterase/lipase At1g71250-like [Cucurbita pepo subsp. pepo]